MYAENLVAYSEFGGDALRLSTRGRYGVKAMFELAMNHGRGPIPLKEIADRQGLSEHYLEQLVAPLRKAGLVKSVRGAHGGYMLNKDPASISVGDIIRVLEGPIAPTDCVAEDRDAVEHCGRAAGCMARSVWAKVRDSIAEVVDSITLADLCEEARQSGDKNYMYYI